MEDKTGNGYDTSAEEVLPLDARWYSKELIIIDNINKASNCLCKGTGFEFSIGEMRNKFKGIPNQTFWMKNKPVEEGYKV